jgi:PAS domain S-box-containing protein
MQLVHPDDLEFVEKNLEMVVQDVKEYDIDHRQVRPDGQVIWVHAQAELIRDADGNPESLLGTVVDITERKRAESQRDATLAELQRRVAELQALNAMATIVNQSLEVDEILNRAIDEALRLVGVEAAAMVLLDKQAGELTIAAHRGLSDEFLHSMSRIKLGEGLAGRSAQTGKPIVISNLNEYPDARKIFLEKEDLESAAAIPLVGGSGVIGTMNLGASSPAYFDTAGVQLLVSLGQQIAIGVEKARLYAETRRRSRELSVLYTIARTVTESLDLERRLNSAMEAALAALDIKVGGIYLMDPDGETLTLRVYRGVSDKVAKGLQHVKLGEGLSGRAAAEKQPIILDVQDYPSERLAPYILREGLQSLASVPLLAAGQAVGAMNLSARRPRAFSPEELTLLTAIGQQLGSAVHNARLYEAVQQELAERRRAESQRDATLEALRESEERYRNLAESLDQLIYRADAETFVATYVNSAVETLYGYTAEEWLADQTLWENTIHPDDQERVFAEFTEVQKKVESRVVQYRAIRKDQAVRWVEDHVSWERDEQGNPVSMNGVMYDITERKHAEEELRQHREHLEELVEQRTAELKRTNEELETEIAERVRAEEELARQVEELERFNRLAVGRELRMVELKRRVNELSMQLDQEPPYDLSLLE